MDFKADFLDPLKEASKAVQLAGMAQAALNSGASDARSWRWTPPTFDHLNGDAMTNLAHSTRTCPRGGTPRTLMRAALAATCLAMPVASHGQERSDCDQPRSVEVFVLGGVWGYVRDQPRSIEVLACVSGYETFSPDRFGTLASPRPNELGFLLLLRMFRNVCLGLERGETLDAVMPEGFAAYHSSPYYFGDPDATRHGNTTVLSSTGDIDKDEEGGIPVFWLEPGIGGMTCRVEWRIVEEMSPESRQGIAGLLAHWVPWELALVRAERPLLLGQPALSDFMEWDRPCQGRWCPATAYFDLSRGEVTMRMILNITDIEGERP